MLDTLTYGQRLGIPRILESDESELEIYKKLCEELHLEDKVINYKKNLLAIDDVRQQIEYWQQMEANFLQPLASTPEELAADFGQVSQKVGDMVTVYSLARSFSLDPDEVLKWKYSKVFGIMLHDFEVAKYQRRYDNILKTKANRK